MILYYGVLIISFFVLTVMLINFFEKLRGN
jgi:hypothetical protein